MAPRSGSIVSARPGSPVDQPLVPAIARAMRILSVLLDAPAGETLSVIADRAGLSKSTASNLLRTMAHEGVLTYDPETRRYNLGPSLIEFGAVAIGRATPLTHAKLEMTRLAARTGLACLAIQRMPDGHFLTVDKIESRRNIKITIGLGERFPADSPLLSRLWRAWTTSPNGQPRPSRRYTAQTLRGTKMVAAAEREVRGRGYAAVYGEYMTSLNVVGFPIFGADGTPQVVVTMLGIDDDLTPAMVDEMASDLVRAARELTVLCGGCLPDDYPA